MIFLNKLYDEDLITDRSKAKLTIYLNTDNNTSSNHEHFLGQTAVDYMCEGTLNLTSYNGTLYAYTGAVEEKWGWNCNLGKNCNYCGK